MHGVPFLPSYRTEKSMNIIDMLKADPSLVQEIARQRDEKVGQTLQMVDQNRRVYIYGHRYQVDSHPLDAVIWGNAYITIIESYNDVVSFGFGGCVMADFIMNYKRYVAHIHNADIQHPKEDERTNWIQYVKANRIKIQSMFRPANESFDILSRKNVSVQIWGVCTPLGKNYSLILDSDEKNLISIREYHTPTNYSEILRLSENSDYFLVRNTWNRFWQNKQRYEPIYENPILKKLTE